MQNEEEIHDSKTCEDCRYVLRRSAWKSFWRGFFMPFFPVVRTMEEVHEELDQAWADHESHRIARERRNLVAMRVK